MAKAGEGLKEIREQGLSWLVVSEEHERLREGILPLLFQGDGFSGLEALKRTDTRLMLRGRVPQSQAPFLVKVFRSPRLVDGLVSLFRVPRSRKEARVSLALKRRSVPCPQFIASGVLRSWGVVREDYAVAWEIPGAVTVLSWVSARLLDRGVSLREKLAVVGGLARFVRFLHDQGVYSSDFHQGNIVFASPAGDPPRFYLVDLHSLTLTRKPLDRAQRVATLAQLNDFHIPLRHRARFLKAYLGHTEKRERKEFGRAIAEASLCHWKALWRKRRLRCLQAGKGVQEFSIEAWRGLVRNGYRPEALAGLLASGSSSASEREVEKIKQGTRALILRGVYQDRGTRTLVVIKHFRELEGKDRVCGWLRRSRAKRAWINSHNLLMRGIPTPQPVAFGERNGMGGMRESFLVTEEIVAAEAADRFLTERVMPLPDEQRKRVRRQFAGLLAAMVRWMHQSGISHGDLKASNILVAFPQEEVSLSVVDLDGVRIQGQVSEKYIAKDLGRMGAAFAGLFTSAEEEHFLQCYRKGHDFFRAHEKKIMAMVRQRKEEKIAQKQKNNGGEDGG